MRLSRFAVCRPIFTIMAVLIVVILGMISLARLPIDLMPDITYPVISISTNYENASPEEIEELITRPIEEAMSAVPGVEEVTSSSSEGRGNVRVAFTWGTDLDAAAADIRDRLDRVIPRLPEEADRPTLFKFDLAAIPILIMGATSKLDPIQMQKIITDQIKYRIERVPGVASLDIWGGLDREIHVNLHPDKVKALQLPITQIMSRIRQGNINLPAGTVERGNFDVMVRTQEIYKNLGELRNTVVAVRNGAQIKLDEIAEVEDSYEDVSRIARINGVSGVRLSVFKQSGTNTVEVARVALKEFKKVNADIPQVEITTIIDMSDYIERSITNVGSMATYGGLLAIFVLMFFLRNIRSTVIIATAIPISVIATFALMYFGKMTLNIMSLGGLALGVGMLVDNAIVVLENIYRMREDGAGAEEAAIDGSAEVTSAILASTLTTLAVFLPLIFVRGMAGVMFKQLSLVVSFSLICALLVALTLVPMLAARLLKPPRTFNGPGREPIHVRLFKLSGGIFEQIENMYKDTLEFSLNHRKTVVMAAAALLGGSLLLIPFIGAELMPSTDEGEVRVYAEAEVGTRLDVMDEKMKLIEKIVTDEVPELESRVSRVGGSRWRATGGNSGQVRIALVPQAQRSRSSEEIADSLRPKVSKIPGVTVRTRMGQGLFIFRMTSTGTEKVSVDVRGYDLETADMLAKKVKDLLESIDGVTDAQISRESGSPEEMVVIDREKAADMGLTVLQIADALETSLSGSIASYYREEGDEYAILVRFKDAEKMDLDEILDLDIVNERGQAITMRSVVDFKPRSGPVLIERKDQERIISVSANISGRDLGSIISDAKEKIKTITLPRDFNIVFSGDYEEQQEAFRELALSFALAIVLVYMVLASLYESLRDPFIVMFSVPLAIIGVLVLLLLTGTTFNVQSFIGCIMLAGIVVNNAVLLVDHINLLRRRDGMGVREAIMEAGRRRLRPILMTAMTTMLGLAPLAIGMGEGGEAQAPMARAVVGGLLSSTFITLLIVPVLYSIAENYSRKKKAQSCPE